MPASPHMGRGTTGHPITATQVREHPPLQLVTPYPIPHYTQDRRRTRFHIFSCSVSFYFL